MRNLIDEKVKVDLILTDPPYGTTKCKWDSIIPLEDMWDCINGLSNPNTPCLLFCDEPFSSRLRLSNLNDYKYDWLWIKEGASNIFNAKRRPLKYHENVAVFYKQQCKFYPDRIKIPRVSRRVEQGQRTGWVGISEAKSQVSGDGTRSGKYISDVSKYDKDWKNPSQHIFFSRVKANSHEKVDHPTQKPVKLMEHFIKAYTDEDDLVLDFTMGSGSTGVACRNLNRRFIGVELSDEYFEIAKSRIFSCQSRLI
ncbi:DNA-methyltransferase [Methanobrevibacter sp.]|uniref:DNA-methyltransferase n=1 Tax=Methanobrevibacter sp. TaxID=66852 RepID=UPI003868D62B